MRTMAIVKSTAIYLSFSLVIYVLFLGVSADEVSEALNASNPSVAQLLVSIGAIATPVMVVVLALHALWTWIQLHTIHRNRSYTTFESFVGGVSYAIRGPVRGFGALSGPGTDLTGLLRRKSQAGSVIHFVFSCALLAYLVLSSIVVWHAYR